MEPRTEPPPCHLLRLPYELLKPILAELSKQDQISTAKTCVILWELAYPMAYNHITVTIRPGLKDSAWQHLASGVGLRYVQHLTISSSHDDTEKGKRLKDLVTGTLIAALRRNQLLSFTSTPPATWKGSISMNHVVSLIETQGSLQTLGLPGLQASSSIRLRDYFDPTQTFSRINELTIALSHNQNCDGEIYEIVKKSPDLRELHIGFSHDAVDTARQNFPNQLHASLNRQHLHNAVTRLTLQGTIFFSHQNRLSFPALRALAVIDCKHDGVLFMNLHPADHPQLRAIMIKKQGVPDSINLRGFMRGLRGLRELIVHGDHTWFDDGMDIARHGETLHILSLVRLQGGSCFDEVHVENVLKNLSAIRHLSLFITHVRGYFPGTLSRRGGSSYHRLLDVLAGYGKLQTFGLRCDLSLSRKRSTRDDEVVEQTDYDAFCERLIGRDAIDKIKGDLTHQTAHCLEYVAVKADCRLYPGDHERHQTIHRIQSADVKKYIFALKPRLAFMEASESKQRMLDRYSGNGYYFLEEYIDGLMEKSEVSFNAGL